MKSALLTYIGLLEVDKAAFPSLVDVLRENRYNEVYFRQITLVYRTSGLVEQDKPAGFKETQGIKQKSFR